MTTATYIVGEARAVLATMAPGSIQSLITSPPYPWQRAYLPPDHPDKDLELGQEPDPAAAIDALLLVMDAAWDVLTDDATFWLVLGDAHAGSGGSGGDYNEGGLRDGQQRYDGTAVKARRAGGMNGDRPRQARNRRRDPAAQRMTVSSRRDRAEVPRQLPAGPGWPLEQSVCWWPHMVGASMAYGRNLLNGNEHRQWVTRPPITWCKPAPTPGALKRRFRTATELIVYGGKRQDHYFDLDSVRYEPTQPGTTTVHNDRAWSDAMGRTSPNRETRRVPTNNEKGAPPLNWCEVDYPAEHVDPDYWVINTSGYPGAHFATYPPELLRRPVLAGCPLGGTIIDPFAGTFTTAIVANGNGRNAVGIDLDSRNADLARARVGMFLDVREAVAT